MQILDHEWLLPVDEEERIYLKEKRREGGERGPAILMVHGANALGHLGNYDIPLPGFSGMEFLAARGYDVFALDMRGFGRSSKPENLSVAHNVDDVHVAVTFILEELGIKRLSLLGGSYGGPIVITYASRHPDLLERLIVLATAYKHTPPPEVQARIEALVTASEAQNLAYIPMPVSREADETFVETEQAFLDWRFEVTKSPDYIVPVFPFKSFPPYPDDAEKTVRDVTIPTLIALGDRDFGVPIEDAIALFNDLGATEKSLLIIGNAGHSLMYETKRNYIWSLICSGLPPAAI